MQGNLPQRHRDTENYLDETNAGSVRAQRSIKPFESPADHFRSPAKRDANVLRRLEEVPRDDDGVVVPD